MKAGGGWLVQVAAAVMVGRVWVLGARGEGTAPAGVSLCITRDTCG